MIVEIDDEWHNVTYDQHRDHKLQQLWIKTIRYTNDEVMNNGNNVADDITKQIRIREQELSSS